MVGYFCGVAETTELNDDKCSTPYGTKEGICGSRRSPRGGGPKRGRHLGCPGTKRQAVNSIEAWNRSWVPKGV